MSSSSSPTLVLELRRPWLRALPAALLLAVALTLPWLADTASIGLRALVTLTAVDLAAVAFWQSGIGRSAARLATISWDQGQQWRLQSGTSEPITASLSGRSWLSPWLMCLKFKAETGIGQQIMLWRGELSPTAWQQWQLRLRLEAGQGSERQTSGATP